MKKYDTVIFDLGGVMVDWSPDYVYKTLFENEEEMKTFLQEVCTPDWNEEQDGGRTIQEATDTLIAQFPHHEANIRVFYDRWEDMLKGPIEGSVDILRELKEANNVKLYALTNWSAELFPIALNRYEFLHWFEGRLVSGEEKMRKPFKEIYELLLKRYNIDPHRAVYIDDNLRNLAAPKELGLHTIHFSSPEQLRKELEDLQILPAGNK
ncbi:MAG: HAD family phosphatase [Flavitalea sp.]